MRSGRTLLNLAQELERQLDTKKDLVVSSPLVRHSSNHPPAKPGAFGM